MGRYLTEQIDKAEQLEEWVQKLTEETNRNLDGSELYDVGLNIRKPFELKGQKYNNGFVSVKIRFDSKEPDFLTEEDRKFWYSRMNELKEKRFGMNETLDYTYIPFEEPSEEELYILTPHKESTIKSGFDRIREYAKWYCSAVKDYGKVVQAHDERMRQHLTDLETLSE